MASVRSGPFDQKNTTYIVTGANLANDLVTYTQSLSAALVQTGLFAAHANAALVIQGYLLVDTGKRLVPGQQPNVPTLLIGVNAIPMDSSGRRLGAFAGTTATAITGFIDPNSPNVAIYSRDRPVTFNDNLYFSGATNLQTAGNLMTNASLLGSSGAADFTTTVNGGGVRHRGPSIYSGGVVTAGGGSVIPLTATSVTSNAAGVATALLYSVASACNAIMPGSIVTTTGFTPTGYNLTNAVVSAVTTSNFTIVNSNAATLAPYASGGTVTETLFGLNVIAGGANITGPLVLNSGPIVTKVVNVGSNTLLAGGTININLDLSQGSVFTTQYGGTVNGGNVLFRLNNSVPGSVFYVAVDNLAAGPSSNTFSGATVFTNGGANLQFTVAAVTKSLTTCVVTA